MYCRSLALLSVATILVGCTAKSMSASQVTQPDGSTKCSVSAKGVPLRHVVETISGRMGKTVSIDDDVDARQPLTVEAEADSWDSCLKLIAGRYRLEVNFDDTKQEYELRSKQDE